MVVTLTLCGICAFAALTALGVGVQSISERDNPIMGPATAMSQESSSVLTIDEQKLLNEVNAERVANGRNALLVDPKMVSIARRHSQEMVGKNYFSHVSPANGTLLDRVVSTGALGWIVAGENLAGAPTVEAAHLAVLESPPHKENLLDTRYTHVGIGVADGGPYGKMFTEDFIAYETGSGPADIVNTFALEPNPLYPRRTVLAGRYATFFYSLKRPATVTIEIYSWRGLVKILKPATVQAAGYHHVTWTGTNDNGNILERGNYRYILTVTNSTGREQKAGIISVR